MNKIINIIFFVPLIVLGFINKIDAAQQPPAVLNRDAKLFIPRSVVNANSLPPIIGLTHRASSENNQQSQVQQHSNVAPECSINKTDATQHPIAGLNVDAKNFIPGPAASVAAAQAIVGLYPPIIGKFPQLPSYNQALRNRSLPSKASSAAVNQQSMDKTSPMERIFHAVLDFRLEDACKIITIDPTAMTKVTVSPNRRPGQNIIHLLLCRCKDQIQGEGREDEAVKFLNFLNEQNHQDLLNLMNALNLQNAPLLFAVSIGHFKLAEAMIIAGADVTMRSSGQNKNVGQSIFGSLANFKGNTEISAINFMRWLKSNMSVNLFSQLLNSRSAFGFSPLSSALQHKKFLLAEEMIRMGADVLNVIERKNIFMMILDICPNLNFNKFFLQHIICLVSKKYPDTFDAMWQSAIIYEKTNLKRDLLSKINLEFMRNPSNEQLADDSFMSMVRTCSGASDTSVYDGPIIDDSDDDDASDMSVYDGLIIDDSNDDDQECDEDDVFHKYLLWIGEHK